VFRYQYSRPLLIFSAVWVPMLLAFTYLRMRPWQWQWRSASPVAWVVALSPLCTLPVLLVLHLSERRRTRDSWVRLRLDGLAVSNPGETTEDIAWAQIASIATDYEPGAGSENLTISTHDGRTVEVDPGIERGDELCQAVWDTGRFVSDGEAGATRWVPKQPEPLPAPEAGSS